MTRRCRICVIPERNDIDVRLRGGVGAYTVGNWLVTQKGYSVAFKRAVVNHRMRRHHTEDATPAVQKASKPMSLADFVLTHGPRKCPVCAIPERSEVDEALRNGAGCTVVATWLMEEKGYDKKIVGSTEHHKRRMHHLEGISSAG